MIYEKEPVNFNPVFEVSSLFCESGGEIVLLKRGSAKHQPEKWGVPAGKTEEDVPLDAVLRETEEETGIKLNAIDVEFFKKVFVRYSDIDFIYHMFHTLLPQKPNITINPLEHSEYAWVTPLQALQMNLVEDLDACIRMFYKIDGE